MSQCCRYQWSCEARPICIHRDDTQKYEIQRRSQTAYICEFNYIFMRVYLCRHIGVSFVLSQRAKYKMRIAKSDSECNQKRFFTKRIQSTVTSSGWYVMSQIISVRHCLVLFKLFSEKQWKLFTFALCFMFHVKSNEKYSTMETAS